MYLKCFSVFLLVSLVSFPIFSQDSEILFHRVDSCKSVGDTFGVARAYFGLVKNYDLLGDDEKLSLSLDSALRYAMLSKNRKAYIKVQTYQASYISDKGRHEESIEMYRNIYNGYLEIGDTAKAADMLMNIGMEYNNIGRYSDALNEELSALKMREDVDDLSNIAKYYQLIGEVYKQLGQKDKWREFFQKADSLARSNDLYANFFTKVGILNDLGGFYENDNELDKAKVTYEELYMLCEKEQYVNGQIVALGNLVPVLKKMGLKHEALAQSLKVLSISEKTDRAYHIICNLNSVAEQYLNLNKAEVAVQYFLRAEQMAASKEYPLERMQSWKGLCNAYKNTGDYRNALKYFELETEFSDSLKGVEVKKNVAELETRYQTEKKEQQIRELSLQSELSRKKVRTLIGFVVVSILLIILLIYIISIRKKAIDQQKELIAKQREVAHLNQEKLRMEIDQKNRELSSLALQMACKSELVNELKGTIDSGLDSVSMSRIVRVIENEFNSSSDWEAFRLRFEEVHPSFFKSIKTLFPDLTQGELKLCALLQLNLTSKEIASINNITVAAVDKSRNRLRKKLNLSPDESLNEFLGKF
ncbi:MAG: hypothetical protein AB7S48_03935 [Bacteroidales bacterium]